MIDKLLDTVIGRLILTIVGAVLLVAYNIFVYAQMFENTPILIVMIGLVFFTLLVILSLALVIAGLIGLIRWIILGTNKKG